MKFKVCQNRVQFGGEQVTFRTGGTAVSGDPLVKGVRGDHRTSIPLFDINDLAERSLPQSMGEPVGNLGGQVGNFSRDYRDHLGKSCFVGGAELCPGPISISDFRPRKSLRFRAETGSPTVPRRDSSENEGRDERLPKPRRISRAPKLRGRKRPPTSPNRSLEERER